MEVNGGENGGIHLRLERAEVRKLRVALQRALFEDVPPQQLGAALDFADQLLRAIDEAGRAGEGTA